MDKRMLKSVNYISALIAVFVFLRLGSTVTAYGDEAVYFYDDLGRLSRVVTKAGDAVSYSYDEVGNLLSRTRGTISAASPLLAVVTPEIIFPGTRSSVTITGSNLIGTREVKTDNPSVKLGSLVITDTAITAQLIIPEDMAPGIVNISVATVFGAASVPVIIGNISIKPPISVVKVGEAVDFTLVISPPPRRDLAVSLSSDVPSVMAPGTAVIGAGQSSTTFTAAALAEGTAVVWAGNGAAPATVYVTPPFVGAAAPAARPFSVVLEAPSPVPVPVSVNEGPFVGVPVSVTVTEKPPQPQPAVLPRQLNTSI